MVANPPAAGIGPPAAASSPVPKRLQDEDAHGQNNTETKQHTTTNEVLVGENNFGTVYSMQKY